MDKVTPKSDLFQANKRPRRAALASNSAPTASAT